MNTFTLDKEIIKKSFSKAASTYDAYSTLQKDAAKDLLKLKDKIKLFPVNTESYFALDIGCGTGALAFSFKNANPNANVFGCDFSLPMIFKAKEKICASNIRLLTSDCDELPFVDSFFDSVISSLTFQWVPDIARSFNEVRRILKPGGLFLFSIIGSRTLEELRTSYKKTEDAFGQNGSFVFKQFYNAENLSDNLKKAGFEIITIENVLKKKNYKNLWDLLKTLKATGASPPFSNGNKSLAKGLFLKKTAITYQKHFPASTGDGIAATYDVAYAAVKK